VGPGISHPPKGIELVPAGTVREAISLALLKAKKSK